MPGIFGLFNLFSLLYIFRGAQIVLKIRNEWQALHEEPLTRAKKHLADSASFFIAVPPGVAIHEFSHAMATWAFGGKIVDFGYGVFWGYVVPVGNFTNGQNWFIAIAGTLGSLLYGTAVYFLFRNHKSSSFRYFGLRAFRFQIYFALLYYPVLTIVMVAGNTGGSDWAVIYNFAATPILSMVTAVFHITALAFFYISDRNGRFEMPTFATAATQNEFFALEKEAAFQPQNKEIQLQYVAALQEGDAKHKAKTKLKQYLQENPNVAEGWLLLAQMEIEKTVSKTAKTHLDQALQLGLSDKQAQAHAHLLLGRYYLDRNELTAAEREMDVALQTAVPTRDPFTQAPHDLLRNAQLYYWRSQVYRRQENFAQAEQDIATAIQLAQVAQRDTTVTYYQEQQTIIHNHAHMLKKGEV